MPSTIHVNETTRTFTATARGSDYNNPTDPRSLSDNAAVRAIQFYFYAQLGYVEAEYIVTSDTAGCTGRELLFAGDSVLCDSPPSAPPLPPVAPPPIYPGFGRRR